MVGSFEEPFGSSFHQIVHKSLKSFFSLSSKTNTWPGFIEDGRKSSWSFSSGTKSHFLMNPQFKQQMSSIQTRSLRQALTCKAAGDMHSFQEYQFFVLLLLLSVFTKSNADYKYLRLFCCIICAILPNCLCQSGIMWRDFLFFVTERNCWYSPSLSICLVSWILWK